MQENMKMEVYSWIKSLGLALIIAFLCREFIFTPTTVFGESMSPTFQDKDRVIISRTSEIERFDVVVFDAPDADEHYIKRVIGLPGDRVEMKDDVLYINGKATLEPYLNENKQDSPFVKLTGDFTLKELTGVSKVPENSLFVMGDNRLRSKDSRYFGFVPFDSIVGEAKIQIYPLKEIGILK